MAEEITETMARARAEARREFLEGLGITEEQYVAAVNYALMEQVMMSDVMVQNVTAQVARLVGLEGRPC